MSKEFEDLLGQYWDFAHLEGKSGVSQGDKANEVLHALKKLAEQPAQPSKPWVGLTDDEILYCVELENPKAIAEEVEAKLREKNA